MPQTVPVTCVITNFNGMGLIEGAVASVLNQTMVPAEILIADDASQDGSREWLRALEARQPQVRALLSDENLGVAANRDLAMRAASQPFVTHFDGDDLIAPRKIEAEWRALAGREDAVACSRIARLHLTKPWRSALLDPAPTVTGSTSEVAGNMVSRRHPIPRDMMMSKSLFEAAGGFRHGMNLFEDWEFKLRLAALGPAWSTTQELGTLYLQHGSGLSKVRSDQLLDASIGVIERCFDPLLHCMGEDQLWTALNGRFGPDLQRIRPEARRADLRSRFGADHQPQPAVAGTGHRKFRDKVALLQSLSPLARGLAARRAGRTLAAI